MIKDSWFKCYDSSWKDVITPESFCHPAKASFGLAARIYEHAIAEGWLPPGSIVVDPFAGIGGFAFHAMRQGLNWVGVELEQKFVDLAQQNIDLWLKRYAPHFPGWGTAKIIQGDSRELASLVGDAVGVVSSPPFTGTMVESGDPNYAHKFHGKQKEYSPKDMNLYNGLSYMSPEWIEERKRQAKLERDIANLPDEAKDPDYPTFWSEAKKIVQQTYQVLAPGAHAIWVVKAFVKNKQRVDFPGQWQQLCEACGFVTLHYHKAWLVKELGTQLDFEGNPVTKTVEHKSFFRRLAENKGSPRIDYEVVLCMQKPGEGDGVEACISSPLFENTFSPGGDQLGHMKNHALLRSDRGRVKVHLDWQKDYGSTPGNLGNMKSGDFEEVVK